MTEELALPNEGHILQVAQATIQDSNGVDVPFGDLFKNQKTIIVFIR